MCKLLFAFCLAAVCLSCNSNSNKPADQPVNTDTINPTKMPETGHIKGPSGSLYYDDGGQGGIPVVFVHSFGGSSVHWQAQLEYLRKTRRAVALDLRGHGRSDSAGQTDYSVAALAADIAAVVDGLGLDSFVLVGHSMGGAACIAYAGAHPQQVAGLVMSGTPGKSSSEQSKPIIASLESDKYEKVMQDYMNRLLTAAKPKTDSLVRIGSDKFSRETNLLIIKSIFQYDPLPALKNYPGPKLIINTPQEQQGEVLAKQIPDVPAKTINGTSHWTQMDKPEQFNAILDEFLRTVDNKKQEK